MDIKLGKRKHPDVSQNIFDEADPELVSDDGGFFPVRPTSRNALYKDVAELSEKQRQRARARSPGAVAAAKQRTSPY